MCRASPRKALPLLSGAFVWTQAAGFAFSSLSRPSPTPDTRSNRITITAMKKIPQSSMVEDGSPPFAPAEEEEDNELDGLPPALALDTSFDEVDTSSTGVYARADRKQAIKRRSYRKRYGFISKAQKAAFRDLWPSFQCDMDHRRRWDPAAAFGEDARDGTKQPVVLEIGIGLGDCLIHLATKLPEARFVGIEVYRPAMGAALLGLHAQGVQNVRLHLGDAISWIGDQAPLRCFTDVVILFPDPFPEARDADRRLLRPLLFRLLAATVAPGGLLHVATDVECYACHALAVGELPEVAALGWSTGRLLPAGKRPSWRPRTKYESKAGGARVWDLCFTFWPPSDGGGGGGNGGSGGDSNGRDGAEDVLPPSVLDGAVYEEVAGAPYEEASEPPDYAEP